MGEARFALSSAAQILFCAVVRRVVNDDSVDILISLSKNRIDRFGKKPDTISRWYIHAN